MRRYVLTRYADDCKSATFRIAGPRWAMRAIRAVLWFWKPGPSTIRPG
jgi:hypothetical protein